MLAPGVTMGGARLKARQFGLAQDQAVAEVRRVVTVVEMWAMSFSADGVRTSDLDALAAQIDRPFLRGQRRAFA